MTPRNMKILDQVRDEAARRDVPAADVERWLDIARPCALLRQTGDGPVVGALRGPVLLPTDAKDPYYPLIASIDCAALPPGVTDLPLPSDGTLLFFGWPEEDGYGEVRYVPAGVAVREWPTYPRHFPPEDAENLQVYAELPAGELHLTAEISLPLVGTLPGPPWGVPLPGHPRSAQLAEASNEALKHVPDGIYAYHPRTTPLLLGGYGTPDNGFDAARLAAAEARHSDDGPGPEDWVLLAEFHGGRQGGATIFWTIPRDDLAALRFDRARVLVDWNP